MKGEEIVGRGEGERRERGGREERGDRGDRGERRWEEMGGEEMEE